MVVFTCNNCGGSLHKAKVSKHLEYECKKKYLNPSLCCVDCLKDFDSSTYVDHTKCLTELERYSKPGFVLKASANKGELKQQSWIDITRTLLKTRTVPQKQRQLLEALSKYENIPRKKSKFLNFISSSLKHIRANAETVDAVFSLLEDEFKRSKESIEAAKKLQNGKKKTDSDHSFVVNNEPVSKKDDAITEAENNEEMTNVETPIEDRSEVTVKKKKKKKTNEPIELTTDENTKETKTETNGDLPKIKKSKHPQEINQSTNCIEQMETETNENDSLDVENPTENGFHLIEKKKKKKKKRHDELSEIANGNVIETGSEINGDLAEDVTIEGKHVSKKKSKKLKLHQEINRSVRSCVEQMDTEANPSESIALNASGDAVTEASQISKKRHEMDHNDSMEQDETNDYSATVEAVVENVEDIEPPANENSIDMSKLSRKDRKEMRKKLKYEQELKSVAQENNPVFDNTENEVEPKKKKKRKHEETVEVETKSKKMKCDPVLEEPVEQPDTNKFSWKETIRKILSTADDREMKLKRLCKAVINEYVISTGTKSSPEDISAIFYKKIKKVPSVTVYKERAKLCEEASVE